MQACGQILKSSGMAIVLLKNHADMADAKNTVGATDVSVEKLGPLIWVLLCTNCASIVLLVCDDIELYQVFGTLMSDFSEIGY